MNHRVVLGTLALMAGCGLTAQAQQATTVLADADHRRAQSLNGEWHYVVDPYDGGLYNFHREFRKDGFFLNGAPETGSNGLVEYDFSKSPTLLVPGDWNTQHESLFYYEGMLWYQRDFTYQPTAGHKTFLHIGAANYRSIAWVNGTANLSSSAGSPSMPKLRFGTAAPTTIRTPPPCSGGPRNLAVTMSALPTIPTTNA